MSEVAPAALGGLRRWFARYRPFVVIVVGVLLVGIALPLRDKGEGAGDVTAAGSRGGAFGSGQSSGAGSGVATGSAGGTGSAGPGGEAATDGGAGPGSAPRPAATDGGGGPGSAPRPAATEGSAGRAEAVGLQPTGTVANCDSARGRIKFPTVYAPPCVQTYNGNGGATWQGVTPDKIKVAVYLPQFNAAAVSIYVATGGDPEAIDPEAQKKVYEGYRKLFAANFETYGRQVEFVYVEASGANTDAQAAKADAIRVAETHKAFASLFGPGGATNYVTELAARGVLCINCAGGIPIEFFQRNAPYAWFAGPGWSVGAIHLGEIIGKGLWGRPARWAGTPDLQAATRKFANVFYETKDQVYRFGADRLDRELAKYGARIAERVPYPFDLSTAQTQARTIIARLKARGVTTVLLATDWVYPVFFTQEATKQAYFPEWFGAGQTTANFFSRAYDQQQWGRAMSANTAPVPKELTDPYRLYRWQFGEDPPAQCCYVNVSLFFLGVHMAGPVLTPETFRDGLFAYPPSGGTASGQVTTQRISFGANGGFGFDDYTGVDDLDLAWWDPTAQGPDETGKNGSGMWRHMDGGKRYMPGQYPNGEPRFFDPAGTVTYYQDFPPSDRPPDYPPPAGGR